jgi:hypothetical protein
VGIEIELEPPNGSGTDFMDSIETDSDYKLIRKVSDGSLRSGIELISGMRTGPMLLSESKEFFNQVDQTLRGVSSISSFRTSTHVHVDCRGMSCEDLSNLAYNSILFEDKVFDLFDKTGSRKERSPYCNPIDTVSKISLILSMYPTVQEILGSYEAGSYSREQALHKLFSDKIRKITKYSSINFKGHIQALSALMDMDTRDVYNPRSSLEWRVASSYENMETGMAYVNLTTGIKRISKELGRLNEEGKLLEACSLLGVDCTEDLFNRLALLDLSENVIRLQEIKLCVE